MNLKTLLQKHSWLSAATILFELYPEEEKNSSGYREVFEKLLLLSPEDSTITIVIKTCKDDFDGEVYVDVSGIHRHPENEEDAISLALEFTLWKEWLGMEIHPISLAHFSELEIIAYCLHEMTFIGFEEERIQNEMRRLKQISEDFKNMTVEEKEANTISLEELLKQLKNDEDQINE